MKLTLLRIVFFLALLNLPFLLFAQNPVYTLISNETWKWSGNLVSGWEQPNFNDTGWSPSISPSPGVPPGTENPTMWGDGTTVYFRKKFILSKKPISTTYRTIGVDDDATIYINGKLVLVNSDCLATVLDHLDLSSYLHQGENTIAVVATNCGGNYGLTIDLDIVMDNKVVTIGIGDLSSNSIVIKHNGDVELKSLIIGNGTLIKKQQVGTATVGSSQSHIKTVTFDFPTPFSTIPKIVATSRNQAGIADNSTFTIGIRSISATSVTFNVVRVDQATLWSQELEVDWIAWE